MNPKAALVMAVIALIAGGVAFYLLVLVPTPEDKRKFDRDVFHYTVSRIDKITAKSNRELIYEIERQGDRWVFKYPALGDADAGRVLRAISDLRFEARVKDDLTAPGSLDRFGLVKPKIEITLHEPGATYVFELGDLNATKDGVYIRVMPGGRVLLTNPVVASLFSTQAAAFTNAGDVPQGPGSGGR